MMEDILQLVSELSSARLAIVTVAKQERSCDYLCTVYLAMLSAAQVIQWQRAEQEERNATQALSWYSSGRTAWNHENESYDSTRFRTRWEPGLCWGVTAHADGASAGEQFPAERCSDILITVLQLTLRDTKHVELRGLRILSGYPL